MSSFFGYPNPSRIPPKYNCVRDKRSISAQFPGFPFFFPLPCSGRSSGYLHPNNIPLFSPGHYMGFHFLFPTFSSIFRSPNSIFCASHPCPGEEKKNLVSTPKLVVLLPKIEKTPIQTSISTSLKSRSGYATKR